MKSEGYPDHQLEVPQGWECYPLDNFVDKGRGISYGIVQPGQNVDVGIPVVRVNNIRHGRIETRDILRVNPAIEANYQRTRLHGGEVLLSLVGTLGECAVVPPHLAGWNVARAVAVIPLADNVDSRWIPICLQSAPVQHLMRSWATTTVQATLNLRDVRRLPILIPPRPTMAMIVEVVGALDDKIESNRRTSRMLERMTQAIFRAWFVDFDPVKAKAAGARSFPSMPKEAFETLPARLVESELGLVPEGWKGTKLGECISFRSGFAFKSQDWQETGVPVVKIGSVKPGIIDLSQVSYVSEEIAQQAARYRLSPADLLIGMTGYVGEVGLVPPTDNLPLLNQRVGKFVISKPGTESLAFWYCTTRQAEFRAFVEARSHGTAQANVSGDSILEFPLTVPPEGILNAFNHFCRPMLDCLLANHSESHRLAKLRDYLLPKLLSGEVQVVNPGDIVGEGPTR